MSYYAATIGWTIYYAFQALTLRFAQPGFDSQAFWSAFSGSPVLSVGTQTIAVTAVAGVLFFGVRDGIERVVKWAILLLVVSLAAVAIAGLKGAGRSAFS